MVSAIVTAKSGFSFEQSAICASVTLFNFKHRNIEARMTYSVEYCLFDLLYNNVSSTLA